jgi:hypothetical protein
MSKMLIIELNRDALSDLGNFDRMREAISEKIRLAREELSLALQSAECGGVHEPGIICTPRAPVGLGR